MRRSDARVMRARHAVAALGAVAALSAAAPAPAQLQGPRTPGVPGRPRETKEDIPEYTQEAPQSVKLFDTRRTVSAAELDIGPVWYRSRDTNDNFERGTGEIAFGTITTTPWKPFYLAGSPQTLLRVLDSKSFAWSVLIHQIAVGMEIGPLRPEVRFGASLLTIDVFHGEWSAELLSPRVGLGLGFSVGKIRLDIQAHSEYLWRWFGPDYHIRGVTLGVRYDLPKPTKRPSL